MTKKIVRKTESLENASSRETKLPETVWSQVELEVKNPAVSADNLSLKLFKLKTLTVERVRVTLPALILITIITVSIVTLVASLVFLG